MQVDRMIWFIVLAVSFITFLYYLGHYFGFSMWVLKKGEASVSTLVEKKIITYYSVKDKHGDFSNNHSISFFPMVFCCCTYIVKVPEGRKTKKSIRVESIEPIYCYFKVLHKDYAIWMWDVKPQMGTKFKYKKLWVATKHDLYYVLTNLLIFVIIGGIGCYIYFM